MTGDCGYCGAPADDHRRADDAAYCARQLALFDRHPEWVAA